MPFKNPKNISAENAIQLISGIEHSEIKTMFEDIGIYALLSYKKDGKILIPFVGEVNIINDGSGLQSNFMPSQFLVRSIGQIENGEDTEFDCMLAKRFNDVLLSKRKPRKNKKPDVLKQNIAIEQKQDGLV